MTNPPSETCDASLPGAMQGWAMTLDTIIAHAASAHADRPVVSIAADGAVLRRTYADVARDARRMSAALLVRGIRRTDRIATLLWKSDDHLVAWYGAMGIGAVAHTLNPRLHPDQVAWIAAHGGGRILILDPQFVPLVTAILPALPAIELLVVAGADDVAATIGGTPAMTFAQFLAEGREDVAWGGFDELTPSGLCYTSGTTGDPKGVLYTHRSNFLHAITANQPNGLALRTTDTVLPIVPMFHANAWGLPFIAPMTGAGLVLPGPRLDGASLHRLMEREGVTFAAGVPTVCQGLLRHLEETGASLTTLRRMLIGGSAVSRALIEAFEARGVEIVQGWGMTETSPLAAMTAPVGDEGALTREAIVTRKSVQGRIVFPNTAKVVDEGGHALPCDGVSAGLLKIRGPIVVDTYFGAGATALDGDGFFDTGDIAVIDPQGFIRLVDRAKDVVKSGGEWISSIDLENMAMSHPQVLRAAVIAVPDETWGERPLLVVETGDDRPSPAGLIDHLTPLVPRWWLPERIAYAAIPLGATGKIDKVALRRLLASDAAPDLIATR
ncbi:AMP-binding protein [Sphingomonas profundi]|uniref:AMP-binding protein n=1 Tax=Alterirhizorhabdus profundi TaxID=2681549 RepID=UPI001E4B2EA7|nr:AMP-binding protein [Sphingomonas profundi]